MRTYADPTYRGVEGNLYVVDTDSGVTRLVVSLTYGGKSIGLDGLAIHPKTGIFYGITSSTSTTLPRSLVRIDPKTGALTPVGDLGHAGSDIEFDPDGVLYMWLPTTSQLATVNIDTGSATPVGNPFQQGTRRGGIALIGGGRALVAASGGKGTLDTADMSTGVITPGPSLVGAPFPELINSLAVSPRGVIYGINTNGANPQLANLVSIDPKTGKVTGIGPLPDDTDALSFGPTLSETKDVATRMQEWRFPVLAGLFVIAIVIVFVMIGIVMIGIVFAFVGGGWIRVMEIGRASCRERVY
jgi:hypothetical protein